MEKNELENIKKYLTQIEQSTTQEDIKKMTKEEIQEYITLVAQIKARIEILENLIK